MSFETADWRLWIAEAAAAVGHDFAVATVVNEQFSSTTWKHSYKDIKQRKRIVNRLMERKVVFCYGLSHRRNN